MNPIHIPIKGLFGEIPFLSTKTIGDIFHGNNFNPLSFSSENEIFRSLASQEQSTTKVEQRRLEFDSRDFHPIIVKHSRQKFLNEDYNGAVFETYKAFDKHIQKISGIEESGVKLMKNAFSENSSLWINSSCTLSEKSERIGILNLSVGLMFCERNPLGHEPELDWPLTKIDALDSLSSLNLLLRKINKHTGK